MLRLLEACSVLGLLVTLGCAASEDGAPDATPSTPGNAGGASVAGTGGGGSGSVVVPSGGSTTLNLGGSTTEPVDEEADPMCQPKPVGVLRDFQAGGDTTTCPVNLDLQNPIWGTSAMPFMPDIGLPEPGIAQALLGLNHKPVFSGTAKTVHSADTFAEWYKDDPKCNRTVQYELPMQYDMASGKLVFDSKAFFPLDDVLPPAGFGMSGLDDQQHMHDFHFTFELHMTFRYAGTESFRFVGDDDLWVFINGKLAIDLGGVHAPMTGNIDLPARAAELGLEPGKVYPIDFFQAERMTSQSNFHVETSLAFTNCKPIIVPK
jgi:fibro-slime domain-containing protein